jgi:HPt (histidine-containing phosphotransfer) domain-containing protein
MALLHDDPRIRSATADPASMPALDREHLARYTLGDEALEREVLGLFEVDTPQRIEALRQARTDQEWKLAAHTLKGAGRALGAWRLANSAAAAEAVGGVSDSAACARAVYLIELAAEEVQATIRACYPPL